ncbi:MAG: hypothetical protein ACP5OZ_03015 [Candidatus Woesearchaeota archaeon]
MIKNKKGIGILVAIIIVLIVIFILLVIAGLLSQVSNESAKESACRASVLKNYIGKNALSFSDAVLQCESKDISIKKDGIYINNKKQVSYKGLSNEEVKNSTMKILADEMAKCWNIFVEGKIEYNKVLVGNKILCNVCSKINVKDAPFNEITFSELMDFLMKNEMKDKKMSYFDYLYPNADKNKKEEVFENVYIISLKIYGVATILPKVDVIKREEFNIRTNNEYYLAFIASEGSFFRLAKTHHSMVTIAPLKLLINGCTLLYG